MEYIEFGKIVNTHGIKGEVKIYSYTDNPSNILKLKKVYIENIEYQVERIRLASNMFILKLKGIDRIEDTECIKNKEIYREVLKKEKESTDEFFVRDLIGLDVVDEEENKIGILSDVINTGANDIYIVKREAQKELLLPVIKQVVKNIDIKNKKIVVKIMEGLE